jgi:hypothetical protein
VCKRRQIETATTWRGVSDIDTRSKPGCWDCAQPYVCCAAVNFFSHKATKPFTAVTVANVLSVIFAAPLAAVFAVFLSC